MKLKFGSDAGPLLCIVLQCRRRQRKRRQPTGTQVEPKTTACNARSERWQRLVVTRTMKQNSGSQTENQRPFRGFPTQGLRTLQFAAMCQHEP